MEQQNHKRNSKDKVTRTSESDDRDGSISDEHIRARFQSMESKAEAQENAQRDLVDRLTHMETNVGEIKTAIEGIFKLILEKKDIAEREPEQEQIEVPKSNTRRVSKEGTQSKEKQANNTKEDDSYATPAAGDQEDLIGLNTGMYGFTDRIRNAGVKGSKKEKKNSKREVKIYKNRHDSDPSSDDSDSSSESDSSSSSSSSEDSTDRRRRNQRRRSIMDVLKEQEKPDNLAPNVFRTQPSFAHIKLERVYVSTILKFSEELLRYQNANGVILKATTLVSTSVKNAIMGKCRSIGTDAKFFAMDNPTLLGKLQKLVRVESVAQLVDELNRNIDFEFPSRNTFWTYREFYSNFIIYSDEFRLAYNFLTKKANKVKAEIRWEYKPNTVIKVFVDKLGNYGKTVALNLPQTKWKNLEEFVAMFTDLCASHRHIADKARIMAYTFYPETGAKENSNKKKPIPTYFRTPKGPQRNEASLSQMAVAGGSPEADEIYYDPEEPQDGQGSEDPLAYVDDSVNIYEEGFEPEPSMDSRPRVSYEDFPEAEDSNQDDKSLSAVPFTSNVKLLKRPMGAPSTMVPKPVPSGKDNGYNNACFAFATKGKCDRVRCTYSHDKTACAKLRQQLMERLKIMEASESSGSRPQLQKLGASLSAIREVSVEDTVREDFILNMIPELSLSRSVNHRGVITLDHNGKDHKIPVDVLFDSGSVNASFISKQFLDQRKELWDGRYKGSYGTATLADKVTKIQIHGSVMVPCTFKWKSDEYTSVVKAYIVDSLSSDMIVGLPQIILNFLGLFIGLLQTAVERALQVEDFEPTIQAVHGHGDEDFIPEEKIPGQLYEPWTIIDEEAPEDVEIELPCSFSYALHYMELPYEEAVKEYTDLIDSHVSAEFLAAVPELREYLTTVAVEMFIPTNWEGIRIPPIEFQWKDTLPERDNIKARPVNPKLMADAKKEFDRLSNHFYTPSNSPHASALVIAPKATKPFIRLCGDYVKKNVHIVRGHFPMPNVKHTLEKIIKYKIFLDIDWQNAYHQFPLAEETSKKLSVVTLWGQVRPRFLPEGVSPASEVMQSAVQDIFKGFEDWMIAIYDNILVLAMDFYDAFEKFKKVIERCKEYNVFLKFPKTWLGYTHCEFFGYRCEQGKFQLTDKRKEAITSIPFPTSLASLRSFLGTSVFFASFVPNFAKLVAPLHDMTAKTFKWDPKLWKVDYVSVFEEFKKALVGAVALFYPDYDLVWILKTDASEVGVGWVLLQLKPIEGTDPVEYEHQPIVFGSKKFSEQARKWFTLDQEQYGGFCGMKSNEYYLKAKPFIWETDHANLQWMEKSTNSRVIRMRIYMQGFSFLIRHIPRRQNIVADWQSKLYSYPSSFELSMVQSSDMISEILGQVHGKRGGHHGIGRTWDLLNQKFPGHRIPYRIVYDFVNECGICQKFRIGLNKTFAPIVRHLKVPEANNAIGIDGAELEMDKNGNRYMVVIRNMFTKLISLYPAPDKTDESLARAMFRHLTTYGLVDFIVSDPGSDLTSKAVAIVNEWFGIHHRLSLVNRHESNGVEGGIKDVTRYIVTLCADERHKNRWSDDSIVKWVEFIMNSMSDSETGVPPYELTFGSKSAAYFRFPEGPFDSRKASQFLRNLNEDLNYLRTKSKQFQDNLVSKRTESNDPEHQNVYQPGDFVLYKPRQAIKPSRFTPKFEGPYEVIAQKKNDVDARHVNLGITKSFYVEDLKIFHGTRDDAQKAALHDQDQYEVDVFLAYRGDPHTRTSMQFLVRFKDQTEVWLPWSDDLFNTVQYEDFCRSKSELFQLVYRANIAKTQVAEINKTPIDPGWAGISVFVDIRSYGASWYEELNLPNKDFWTYVVPYTYERLERKNFRIVAFCEIFNERFSLDHLFIKEYGSNTEFDGTRMTLIDSEFILKYPQVAPKHLQKRV